MVHVSNEKDAVRFSIHYLTRNEDDNMTAFLVFIPILMFIISGLNLILTIKYRNDSRQIDALRTQRTQLQIYSEKLVTNCVGYIEAYHSYLSARLSLEYDEVNNQTITLERSNYVYKLKDDLLIMERKLRIVSSLVDIEMADTDFPKVKKRLVELINNLQEIDLNWDELKIHPASYETINDFDNSLSIILSEIVDLLCKTQEQLRQDIDNTNLYRDIIKHAKHITIDPIFESSEKILESAKSGIQRKNSDE